MSRRHAVRSRARRRGIRGQVLPIFALVGVVLFAAIGLAVDAGMAYLTYNGAERAAAAAALAGVPYMPAGMPTGTNTTTSCAGTAGAAACAATARAGYANGGTVNGHPVTITVSRFPAGCGSVGNPCADNKLQVQVQAYVQPTFLHVLGFSDHPVTASDTGFFLPPISLGQPGAQLGSTLDQLGTAGSYYFLRSEGYGNPRSEGDAYDPYNINANISCQQSVTTNPAGMGDSTDTHTLSGTTDVSAATMSSASASPLPTRGGYNFSIAVPSAIPGGTGSAQVYNPAFAPDGGFNPSGGAYNLHEQDSSFSGNTYTDQYSAMEYTLFKVNDRFDHSTDVPLSQIVVDPLNVTITGGAVSSFVDVRYPSQTLSASSNATVFNYVLNNIYHSWVNVGTPPVASTQWISGGTTYNIMHVIKGLGSPLAGATPAATYRLRVDMLDYNGLRPGDDAGASSCSRAHKGYAVELAASTGGLCTDPGCQMSALDELAVYTPIITAGSSGFSIPLFNLPADYAGQTINFYIYDVGDVSGSNSISIQNPDTASCGANPTPCLFTTSTGVNVYDLGISRNTSLTGNLLYPNGTADQCASPAVQPNGTQALVNTYPIAGGCSGRASTFFNGRWLLFQLQIPSNYAGGGGNYWQMHYSLTSGTASDTFTIAVNYANSPVHLL
jgi:Flp pilus assembly protein TadG